MNTTTQTRNHRSGSALILALTLVAVVATASASAYFYVANQAKAGSMQINLLKARSIAESGLTIAYNQARANTALLTSPNAWPWASFDGGQYMVTATSVSTNLITMISIGTYNGVQSQARIDLHYYPSTQVTVSPSGSSGGTIYGPYTFTNVLFVGGTLSWKGCGTLSGGNVYVNGLISLGGNGTWQQGTGTLTVCSSTEIDTSGSGEITCTSAKAPVISQKKSDGIVGTTIIGSVLTPTLPSIELSPFYQTACNNHQVVTGSVSVADGTTPPGGVLWCEGTLDFKGTATGCFISTLGVSMEAGADVHPYTNCWPTIYNKAGDVSFTGQANTYGFVYTGGNVEFTGGGALQGGPVIILGSLTKAGNSDMTDAIPASGFQIIPPVVNAQQTSNTAQRLVVTGWQ